MMANEMIRVLTILALFIQVAYLPTYLPTYLCLTREVRTPINEQFLFVALVNNPSAFQFHVS